MPTARFGRAACVAIAALLAGCAGGSATTPTASPSPSISASMPLSPPLKDDLTGGTQLQLGPDGHWAITSGRAFVATEQGTVDAIDLATGATVWQASFGLGEPWDALPTLGLSADHTKVVALRTVDADGAPRLDLLLGDASSGAIVAEHLIVDAGPKWRVDLPPRVLAADSETVVLAADPESGRQTGVVNLADGELVWQVDDQAVAATTDTVVTRGAGWVRPTGTSRWKAGVPLGPLMAQAPDVVVVGQAPVAVWLDPVTGQELSRTGALGEAEPPCAPTTSAMVCLGEGVTGYDRGNGKRLWSSADPAHSIAVIDDWAYLWRDAGRGDVLDARTGQVLVTDAELPPIRYADTSGVLLTADDGYTWVPFVR